MPHGLPPKLQFQRPDEVTDLEWFLLEVERMECCEVAKARFIQLIKAQAGRVIRFSYRVLVRPDQVRQARELLDAGNPMPLVRDRLCELYDCCPRTAYNLIGKAIRERGQQRAETLRRAQQDFFLA